MTADREAMLRAARSLASRATGDIRMCCHLHSPTCEPPSELCCEHCDEKDHPEHPKGVRCVLALSEQEREVLDRFARAMGWEK